MAENPDVQIPETAPESTDAPSPRRGAIFAWMQLLRVPNLFTVPGDPLAGFLLAASVYPNLQFRAWPALAGAGASLLLYAAGLIQNDLCDLTEDRRERPHRPLPSERISAAKAWVAYALLVLAGVVIGGLASWSAMGVAVILAAVIAVYNRFAKRLPIVGPLIMGICRGLSLLLGAAEVMWFRYDSAFSGGWRMAKESNLKMIEIMSGEKWVFALGALQQPVVLIAAVGMTLYIAAVTQIARGETRARSLGVVGFLPAAILLAWIPFTTWYECRAWFAGRSFGDPFALERYAGKVIQLGVWGVLGIISVAWATHCGVKLRGMPEPARVQRTVGMLIRGLLLIQAALAALLPWPGWIVAAGLLVCWPLAGIVGKRFYGS